MCKKDVQIIDMNYQSLDTAAIENSLKNMALTANNIEKVAIL